jgi:vacuolar-type H+-ATPase subunit F/Vma7
MSAGRVAAIGEQIHVEGFALAGAVACPAENPDEVLAAWRSLPPDVAVVILTPSAAGTIAPPEPGSLPLTVVMPL